MDRTRHREEALADFADWHPTITRLLGEADRLYRWALFDRAPLPRWVDGRLPFWAMRPIRCCLHGARRGHGGGRCLGVAREMTQKRAPRAGLKLISICAKPAQAVSRPAHVPMPKPFTNARARPIGNLWPNVAGRKICAHGRAQTPRPNIRA
ncbi:MAG: hypothetical protein CM15mP55_2520 [Hyphomicrobiales bacterium]|nr:MAG: hypothetical protein CM15mP55_2520 [Hyphomicrobiales bacterium]